MGTASLRFQKNMTTTTTTTTTRKCQKEKEGRKKDKQAVGYRKSLVR
jgi:hypothetical protein